MTAAQDQNARIVIFDDAFFNLANSGIARVWRSVLSRESFRSELASRNFELVLLNRSGALTGLGYREIDFPKYEARNAAVDVQLIDSVVSAWGASLFLSSYYTQSTVCKSLFVVYDLIPEMFGFADLDKIWHERALGLFSSSSFLAISQNTKNDLVKTYPWIRDNMVSVAYPGVNQSITEVNRAKKIFSEKFNLKEFAIWVGSRQAGYKNSSLVFDALSMKKFELDFVFVGGDLLSELENKKARKGGNRVVQLNLDDSELFQAMSEAAVLLYPSLYEGFGLPPLEALSLGTPVITTAAASLPEVTGELAVVISGKDPKELIGAVALATSELNAAKVRELGPEWSQNFTWRFFSQNLIESMALAVDNFQENDQAVLKMVREYSLFKSLI